MTHEPKNLNRWTLPEYYAGAEKGDSRKRISGNKGDYAMSRESRFVILPNDWRAVQWRGQYARPLAYFTAWADSEYAARALRARGIACCTGVVILDQWGAETWA